MIRVVVLLLSLSLSAVTLAAPPQAGKEEQDEPIYIESDSLRIDDVKGISTYQGNVLFRQGTASLRADSLSIHTRSRQEVERIIASGGPGAPARFEQRSEEPGKDASGEAQHIEYIAPSGMVILDGQARFRQGDSQFAGNRIEYDSDKKVVRAGKSVAPEGQGRVRIVIQPRGAAGKSAPSTGGEEGSKP